MIPVLDLLFSIDSKINKLSNLNGTYIPNETKIYYINRAQVQMVLDKIDPNNIYHIGMDGFSKRYKDLEVLQVLYEPLTMTKTTDDLLNSYQTTISSLSYSMMLPTNAYVTASKGSCEDRILDVIQFVPHGDIRLKLKSPHYEPRFDYQETIGSISEGKFFVYSDGVFTIDKLYVSYLRYPKNVDIAGYTHLNGTPSTTVDCELDAYLQDELVNLVVKEIAAATGNQELIQTSALKQKEIE